MLVADPWAVNGRHYERTLRAWLERLDANSEQALALLERTASRREARRLALVRDLRGRDLGLAHCLLVPRQ
jgi:cyclopropane fatty-acyl-phospholipid synthase-like methyltransferase